MSNEVFPALPGLMWDIDREEHWKNMSRESDSGRDFTRAIWTSPQRHYRLQYEFLRSGAEAELQALVGFFNRHKGDFDTWLFDDPMDNVVVNEPLGVTNGTQSTWQLTRAFGGASSPVFDLKATPELYLNTGTWRGVERKYFTPRTNLLLRSQEFGDSYWAKVNATVVDNAASAPDGSGSADKLIEASGTAVHLIRRTGTIMAAGQHVLSVYAKGGERTQIVLYKAGSGANQARKFDLLAGSSSVNGAGFSEAPAYGVDHVGGLWYRCWILVDSTGGSSDFGIQLQGGSYTGDGTSGLYLWGAQLELASSLTPFIPTTGAAVTVTDASINSTGLVTLSPTPAAGGSLSWSGGYYWRCKFKQSRMAYKQFMQHLFSARSVDFKTYKP